VLQERKETVGLREARTRPRDRCENWLGQDFENKYLIPKRNTMSRNCSTFENPACKLYSRVGSIHDRVGIALVGENVSVLTLDDGWPSVCRQYLIKCVRMAGTDSCCTKDLLLERSLTRATASEVVPDHAAQESNGTTRVAQGLTDEPHPNIVQAVDTMIQTYSAPSRSYSSEVANKD